jgi:hypothetical protein
MVWEREQDEKVSQRVRCRRVEKIVRILAGHRLLAWKKAARDGSQWEPPN